MNHRITITHTKDVSCLEAVTMVKLALENKIEKGECITFSNNLATDMSATTKFPSFHVWRCIK